MRAIAVVVVAALAIGLITLLTCSPERFRPLASVDPQAAPEQRTSETDYSAERKPVEPLTTAGLPSLARVLEDYWGGDWPVVQEKARARGIDLGAPFRLRSWSEVEAEAHQSLVESPEPHEREIKVLYKEWPEELSVESLKEKFNLPDGFSDSDLSMVEEAARPFNDQIDQLAREYSLQFHQLLEVKWRRGEFVRAPRSTHLTPDEAACEDCFWAKSFAGSGWSVKMRVAKSECPELIAMRDEMDRLQGARDYEVSVRLGKLYAR